MIPHIGTKGIFKFKSPFDVKFQDTILEVTGLRTFEDIELEGIEVKTAIYGKEGLSEDDYKKGLEDKDTIVIFKGTSNQVHRIPSSYIVNTPITDGVFFKDIYLTVPVGYVPESYDLAKTKKKLEDIIAKDLGVITKCTEVEGNKRIIFTKEDVAEFEKRVLMNREGRGYIDYEDRIDELTRANKYLLEQNSDLATILSNLTNSGNGQKPDDGDYEEAKRRMVSKIVIEVISKKPTDNVVIGNILLYEYPYKTAKMTIDTDPLYNILRPNRYAFEAGIYRFAIGTTTGHKLSLGNRENPNTITELVPGYIIPQVFSVSSRAKFKPQYAKVVIELSEPMNIEGLQFATDDEILDTGNKYKIRTYTPEGDLKHAHEGLCVMNKLAGGLKLSSGNLAQDTDLK